MDDYETFFLAASIACICPRILVKKNQPMLKDNVEKLHKKRTKITIFRSTRSRTKSGKTVDQIQLKDKTPFHKRIHKQTNIQIIQHPIFVGQFWNHVDRDCEIFPTIIPIQYKHLYWFDIATVFGSHYPNQWLERKVVLQLVGTEKNHSMRGCLIPRATTISAFFPILEDVSIDPPKDSLIMMKTGNLHYFMVWQPIIYESCPGFTSGCKCPNPQSCPIERNPNNFSLL